MIRDPNWNPSRGEGFFVVSTWIAAILFSGGTIVCLVAWLNSRESETKRKPWRIASGIVVGLAAGLLPIVVIGVMAWNEVEHAKADEQRARAIVAQQEATRAMAVALREELARLEDQSQNETDPVAKEDLAEKIESLRLDSEKAQMASKVQPDGTPKRSTIRMPFATILIIGLASLLLIMISIVLVARSVSGIVIGCGLGALILVIGFMILILSYWTMSASRGPGPNHRPSSVRLGPVPDRAGPVQVYLSKPGITMSRNGAEIGFEMDTKRLPPGWTIWSVTRKLDLSKGKPRLVSSHPYLLTEKQTDTVTVRIRGIQWNEQSRSSFEKMGLGLHNHHFALSSGKPATLFSFSDEKGIQVTSTLELRPGGRPSSAPGNIIFLREVVSEPGKGKIALAWNDIQTVGEHELVLETRGASVQRSMQDSIELAYFKEAIPDQAPEFSRMRIDGGGAFQFDFPPFLEGSSPTVIIPKQGRSSFIARGSLGMKLFELVDQSTGRRVTAELKLVRVGSLPIPQ